MGRVPSAGRQIPKGGDGERAELFGTYSPPKLTTQETHPTSLGGPGKGQEEWGEPSLPTRHFVSSGVRLILVFLSLSLSFRFCQNVPRNSTFFVSFA